MTDPTGPDGEDLSFWLAERSDDDPSVFVDWVGAGSFSYAIGFDGVTTITRNGEVEEIPPRKLYPWEATGRASCDVFWGSHGCHRKQGHRGWCHCDHEDGGFPYYGRPRKPDLTDPWVDEDDLAEWGQHGGWHRYFFGLHEDENDDAVRATRKLRRAYRFPLVLVLPLRLRLERWRLRRRFAVDPGSWTLAEARGEDA